MSFRTDGISNTLIELKKVKENLQSKLGYERSKRREQEKIHDSVSAKLLHTRELNQKLQETCKVAQHKEIQTQAQANSYEAEINKKRQRMAEINNDLETENNNKALALEEFENDLSQIKDNLLWAKNFYEDNSLQENIQKLEAECTELREEAANFEAEEKSLCEQIDELHMKDTGDIDAEITKEIMEHLKNMLQAEEESIETKLKEVYSGLEAAQKSLSDILLL